MPGLRFDSLYNHVNNHVKECFKNLPELKSISSSLVDKEEYPGYFDLMKANEWFGPFKTLETYYICQISAKSKQCTGWICKFQKDEMEIFEVANNEREGLYRWVSGNKATQYNHYVNPPKKVKEWKRDSDWKPGTKTELVEVKMKTVAEIQSMNQIA